MGEMSRSNWLLERGLTLPDDLSKEDWAKQGEQLARMDDSQQWRWGDWLLAAKSQWGEMYAEAQRISGKGYETLTQYKRVAAAYELCSRLHNLSWSHYQIAAPIEDAETRSALLARAEAEGWSKRRLQEEITSPKAAWRPDEIERKAKAELGNAVVASMRTDSAGRRADETLITWAEATDRSVRIDRATVWGNPFEIPGDGNRDEVVDNYREHFLPFKTSLHDRLFDLRGKVLLCWCHPERCHGDAICEMVDLLEDG